MKVPLIILLIIALLVLGLLAYQSTTNNRLDLRFWNNEKSDDKKDTKDKKDKKDNKDKKNDENVEASTSASYLIEEKYIMPEVLSEISDISYMHGSSFACVQDELGTIFIYNTADKKIEKKIPFAGPGDYEGIAVVGTNAYVVNSSGTVYEVSGLEEAKPLVKEHKTYLNAKNDVEALCYDKVNNRLLLAYKGEEAGGSTKGIYSFDLKSKQLASTPVYSIDLNNSLFEDGGKKKKQSFKPSALAIHPTNGDLYITEGTDPKLLILDSQGKVKSLVQFSGRDFTQSEGITFNAAGELFISNEGKKGNGNILKVKLQS